MTYAKLMRRRAALTRTENGAAALNTTGDPRLDFFSTVGALREADEKRIRAKAHIAIVDGTVCTCESRTFKSNANPQEKTETVKGTVSGTNLTFTFTEDGKTETASGSLSDKEIVIYDPEGNLTLKRM